MPKVQGLIKVDHSIRLFLCVTILMIMTACGGSSDPDVTVDPPVNISFNFQTKGQLTRFQITQPSNLSLSDTVAWEFGDGNQSTERSPVHYFAEAGTYQVTATLTDSQLRETMQTQTITVAPLANCSLDWQVNLPASFANTSQMAGGPPGFVMIGSGSKLLFSENGFDWCEVIHSWGQTFFSVQYLDGKFQALANGFYRDSERDPEIQLYASVYESSDGLTWQSTLVPDARLERIVQSGNQTLAMGRTVAGGSTIFNRNNDGSWAPVFESDDFFKTLVANNNGFLLFGQSRGSIMPLNVNLLWTSQDGLSWQQETEFEEAEQLLLASGNGSLVRLSRFDPHLETSSDGLTWTEVAVEIPEIMYNLTFEDGLFVVHGESSALVSSDGTRWDSVTLPERMAPSQYKIARSDLIWLIANVEGPKNWSADGYNWQAMPEPTIAPNRQWSVVEAYDDGFFVGGFRLEEGGVLNGGFVTESTDGQTWSETMIESGFAVEDLAYTPFGLLAAGSNDIFSNHKGSVFLRDNNLWEETFTHTAPIDFVKYFKNKAFAFTISGEIHTSTDGRQWELLDFQARAERVQVAGDKLWVIDFQNRLLQTDTGDTWVEVPLPPSIRRPFAVAFFKGSWFITGDGGRDGGVSTLAKSTDLDEWVESQLPYSTSYRTLTTDERGIYALGRFTMGFNGEAGTLPHGQLIFSEDGIQWVSLDLPSGTARTLAVGAKGVVTTQANRIFYREPITPQP